MPTLLIKVSDGVHPDPAKRWLALEVVEAFPDGWEFGDMEVPEAGRFYHIHVNDRTYEQVKDYVQSWHHDPVTTQVQNQGDRRLLEVVSTMVSVSGKNAFTQEGVDGLVDELNSYDLAAAYESHTNTTFRISLTCTIEDRPRVIDAINRHVEQMQYARARWYISNAGRDYLAANGGYVSGPASQVGNFLRDGLAD